MSYYQSLYCDFVLHSDRSQMWQNCNCVIKLKGLLVKGQNQTTRSFAR